MTMSDNAMIAWIFCTGIVCVSAIMIAAVLSGH